GGGGKSRPTPRAGAGGGAPRPAARSRTGTAALADAANGSNRSTTASKASSAWNVTAAAPPTGFSPESPSGCSPWPPPSGTTGPPGHPTSAASRPTTTSHQLQGIDHLGVTASACPEAEQAPGPLSSEISALT